MTKAANRSFRSLAEDARRAARGAAHREGKTLGEWLQHAIADQTEDLGLARAGAGTARYGAASSSTARRPAYSWDETDAPATARGGDADERSAGSRGERSKPATEDGEDVEAALATIQRRALRSDRRADDALATIADMMKSNEARRAQERDMVGTLAQKMSELESKLTERRHAGDSPIKGALARLEARLDIIGKRSAAESAARGSAAEPTPDPASVRRLEDKLNAILTAVQVQPARAAEISPIALQAAQAVEHSPRRDLGVALAQITARQEALDSPAREIVGIRRPTSSGPTFERRPRAEAARPRPQGGNLEQEIRSISQRLDGLRANELAATEKRAAAGTTSAGVAPRVVPEAASAAPAPAPARGSDEALIKIERRLDALVGKVDDALSRANAPALPPPTQADHSALEHLVRELGAKIEAVRAPHADADALDSLQQQVERLSGRFERSEQGLAVLPTLVASVRELFDHLEATRANVETSAAHAAREVLRIAASDTRGRDERPPQAEPERPRAPDAERPRALDSVHSMLDQVVDTLSSMDEPSAAPARRAEAPLAEQPLQGQAKTESAPVERRDPIVSLAARTKPAAAPARQRPRSEDLNGVQRADFIAAARRAANAARGETIAEPARRPLSAQADREARAGLLAKSREYVATHKRPLLMAVAALVMVLGTITLLQQIGIGGNDLVARVDAPSTTRIARVSGEASPAARPASLAQNELTPSALPRAAAPLSEAIPGSDPIQTGSIAALPSFAAAAGPSRPMLPAGLKMAAEAGNGAAEYDLGSRYADGRAVARDMKAAAQWFEKAAAQDLAPAQYRLASLYEKGVGVPQDKAKARALYTAAANAGNPRAMHNLAVLLADGDGHPDYAGAATWFRKAAAFGVHDSQYNLAILLARGLGVQQSLVQSYQWFAIAGTQDDADAIRKRDEVGAKLSANELAVAKAFAAAYTPKLADPAASDVLPPIGGWDGAAAASRLNSPKSKVSSL